MNPYNQNLNSGLQSGLNSGLNSGMNQNLQSGLNSGMNSGLNSGFQPGLQSGLNSGLNSGMNQNLQSGFNSGMNTGLQGTSFVSPQTATAPTISKVLLPTQVVEKPIAVHEEIRKEQVEEIQPVINIEKYKTEVHQVTQPLIDKEIKPVALQQRTLAPQVLPEVSLPGRGAAMASDISTVHVQDKAAMVIEKPAIYTEVDKLQVIEEIQPVLYKETIVPTVIQETKPVYQKIVEGPVYIQETLPVRDLSGTHGVRSVPMQPVQQPVFVQPIMAQPMQPVLQQKPQEVLLEDRKSVV